jgi:hypothetical protein
VITVSTRLPFVGFSSPAIKNPANLTLLSLVMKPRRPTPFCHAKPGMIVCVSMNPERPAKRAFGVASSFCFYLLICYFGITSRASLLDTNSLISLLFFPASIIASREP